MMILASMIVIPLVTLWCSLSSMYIWYFMFAYTLCSMWRYVIWFCISTNTRFTHTHKYIYTLRHKLTNFLFTQFLPSFTGFCVVQFLIIWRLGHDTYCCMTCILSTYIYSDIRSVQVPLDGHILYYMFIVEARGQFYIFHKLSLCYEF